MTGCLSGYEFSMTRSVPSRLTSGKIEAREDLPALVIAAGLRIAAAESLKGGLLASSFAEMSGASRFFVGGIVAYSADVKFDALGVTPGPVVNQRAAAEMALGAKRLFGADIVVAVTGVGARVAKRASRQERSTSLSPGPTTRSSVHSSTSMVLLTPYAASPASVASGYFESSLTGGCRFKGMTSDDGASAYTHQTTRRIYPCPNFCSSGRRNGRGGGRYGWVERRNGPRAQGACRRVVQDTAAVRTGVCQPSRPPCVAFGIEAIERCCRAADWAFLMFFLAAWRLGGLAAWRLGGLAAWRLGAALR